jgi:hypothetical protein
MQHHRSNADTGRMLAGLAALIVIYVIAAMLARASFSDLLQTAQAPAGPAFTAVAWRGEQISRQA